MRFCFMFIIQQELDEMKSMWNTHYIREVRISECPPGEPNVLYFIPEQSGGKSFRFAVNEMDINACHHFCELPDLIGWIIETHELVRLITGEEELEFPSNAFYFHHKKHRSTTTLILREYIIRTTQTLYCTDISLMGKNFRRGNFCGGSFYSFNPYSQNLFYIKISKSQELIPEL